MASSASSRGYERLAEFDREAHRARCGNIGRLDLILAAENDIPNRYRLSKQADTLMLLYLLSAEEVRAVRDQLGYPFHRTRYPAPSSSTSPERRTARP